MRRDDVISTDMAYVWSTISDELYHKIHNHAEYEIYYFMQGNVEYRVEGRLYPFTPESLLLIPPNRMHGVTARSTRLYKRASFHFLPELLDETERSLLLELFEAPKRYYPDLSSIHMDFFMQSIMECQNMEETLKKIALKHRIITLLTHVYQMHLQDKASTVPKNERIQAILQYLNDNLLETIPLVELARKFKLNKNHLNVIFRRETGTTINQYIRVKRLVLARQELRKGVSAEDAAYRAGFNDYSNFYRAYKSFFGVIPSRQTAKLKEERESTPVAD
jgi:AraC-like DNA-binding protein